MTQPSLDQTFDTSLIDLGPQQPTNDSFSTSSSTIPSEGGHATISHNQGDITMSTAELPSSLAVSSPAVPGDSTNSRGLTTHYVPTATAYDEWASVYDTDGNILQAVDDLELQTLFPELERLIVSSATANAQSALRLIDLGCGTARNTAKLLMTPWPVTRVQITGYDLSRGMLDIAQTKLDSLYTSLGSPATLTYELVQHDFLNEADVEGPPVFPRMQEEGTRADGLISTLVLEHFPLRPFFRILHGLLKVGGVALVTNMHEDMGRVSQAGFERKDEATGESVKVRGCSWAHSWSDMVAAAKQEGLEVVPEGDEGVRERAVTAEMVEQGVVSQRGTKWVGRKVWFGVILRRVS